MHGTTSIERLANGSGLAAVRDWFRRHRKWCLLVLLPTLLVAVYYYAFAADQFESEAHFVVRSAGDPQPSGSGGLSQVMTMVGATSSHDDSNVVADYLTSHDAVSQLQRQIHLSDLFQRPEADFFSRLRPSRPTPERLTDYYLNKVDVETHPDTGIATLKVRAFRRDDALNISRALLEMSEQRINMINRRNYESAVAMARLQLNEAEASAEQVQRDITKFRRNSVDVNPQNTGQAQTELIGQLQGKLAEARAAEAAMAGSVSASAPQAIAMRRQVAALEQQVGAQHAKISSGPGNVATGLGAYETLTMRQDYASKNYETAAGAYQKAREEAARQQLFLVRVVEPNLPVKSLYPKRVTIVLTVFLGLTLAYGIGWLLVAGVREHAA